MIVYSGDDDDDDGDDDDDDDDDDDTVQIRLQLHVLAHDGCVSLRLSCNLDLPPPPSFPPSAMFLQV